MIFNTFMEDDLLLESGYDKYEGYTLSEATAIAVGECEHNWTKFMEAVGISELAEMQMGELINEANIRSMIETVKRFFIKIKDKIKEITNSFLTKIDNFYKEHISFIERNEKKIKRITLPSDFEYEGYNFRKDIVKYGTDIKYIDTDNLKAKAHEYLIGKVNGGTVSDNYSEDMRKLCYGSIEKESLNIDLADQIAILKNVSKDKSDAKKAYKDAIKKVDNIISTLEKDVKKSEDSDESKELGAKIKYGKFLATEIVQLHGTYLSSLAARARQAKSICVKAIRVDRKNKGTGSSKSKEDGSTALQLKESFIDTDAFIGGVEFI